MAKRRYAATIESESDTAIRVLDAADRLVRSGQFHTATVDDLAAQAGVARATVFARFGSRLGILEALNARCAASEQSENLHRALGIEDPIDELTAVIPAACRSWEAWGPLHQHLRAIVVLEPAVGPLVDAQRQFHQESLVSLVQRLDQRRLLRDGLSPDRAAAAMLVLTGLDTYMELRHQAGLTLDQTIQTVRELVESLLRHIE